MTRFSVSAKVTTKTPNHKLITFKKIFRELKAKGEWNFYQSICGKLT